VLSLSDRPMQLGNRIRLRGHTTDFYQTVASMEVDHQPVSRAETGQTVGLKVTDHAREHDTVYLVT
jgi:putative protease